MGKARTGLNFSENVGSPKDQSRQGINQKRGQTMAKKHRAANVEYNYKGQNDQGARSEYES